MKSLCLMMALACAASANDGGALAGRITDPSGAGVPGVLVRITGQETGEARQVQSGEDGRYRATGLSPGRYAVAASSQGFAPFARRDVIVGGGETATLNVLLQISAISEQITVAAKAPAGEGAFETRPENSREYLEIHEVRESAAKDVGEAVSSLEGLWKIRKGGIANDIVLRGFQQGNVNVLIDGVRINAACPNHMDPSAFHVDFAEVESVQVTKGPFDIRNQGSLGGTVSIVNKRPADGLHISPNLSAGSFGFVNPSVQASYSKGRLNGLGGYSYRRADPYLDGSGRRVTEYANYTRDGLSRPAFDIQTAWGRLGGRLSETQTAAVSYTHQAGGLTLYPYLLMDAVYDNADRLSADWTHEGAGGPVQRLRAGGYFSQVKHWMTDELRASSAGAPRGFGMATFAGTRALGGRFEAELARTIVGIEGYQRDWEAVNTMRMAGVYTDQPALPDVRMLVGGAYAQHRRDFGKLQLTLGGRLDAVRSEARRANLNTDLYWAYNGTRSTSQTDAAPSGTLWLTYALPKEVQLFGGFGSTVRMPDPQERYFMLKRSGSDWVGNPNLVPTRNTEADAGINIHARRFTLRPTLFYSRLDNFVALQGQKIQNPTPGIMNPIARSYENVDARMWGGEVSYGVPFGRALLLSGGASYVRGIQYAKPSESMPGGNIAEIPPLKGRSSLRYGNRIFYLEAEVLAFGAQDKVDPLLRERPTPGYALFGVKGGIHHKRVNLAVGIDNLFNRFYYDHLSFQRDPYRTGTRIPEPGRAFFLNLSYRFD